MTNILSAPHSVLDVQKEWINQARELAKEPLMGAEKTAYETVEPDASGTIQKVTKERVVPRTTTELRQEIRNRLAGFPAMIGGMLYAPKTLATGSWADDGFCAIENAAALKARVADIVGNTSVQIGGQGRVSAEEVFEALKADCTPGYTTATSIPHYPLRKDVFYAYAQDFAPTENHAALEGLLNHFLPATEADKDTLRALVLSGVWSSGIGGKRPCIVLMADEGSASGKSSTVQYVARVYDGVDLMGAYARGEMRVLLNGDRKSFADKFALIKRNLANGGAGVRYIVLDNLEEEITGAELTGTITSPVIDCTRLYAGDVSIVNDYQWCITSNGCQLKDDMLSRCLVIHLLHPTAEQTAGWEKRIERYVEENRHQIIGDAIDLVKSAESAPECPPCSRFGLWDQAVLWPACGFNEKRFAAIQEKKKADAVTMSQTPEAVRTVEDELRARLRKATMKTTGFGVEVLDKYMNTSVLYLGWDIVRAACKGDLHVFDEFKQALQKGRGYCTVADKSMERWPQKEMRDLRRRSGILWIGQDLDLASWDGQIGVVDYVPQDDDHRSGYTVTGWTHGEKGASKVRALDSKRIRIADAAEDDEDIVEARWTSNTL